MDLGGIRAKRQVAGAVQANPNVLPGAVRKDQLAYLVQHSCRIDLDGLRGRRSSEREHRAHDAFQAVDFAVDDARILPGRAVRWKASLLDVEARLDGGKRIADLMGKAGGEDAAGGQVPKFFIPTPAS